MPIRSLLGKPIPPDVAQRLKVIATLQGIVIVFSTSIMDGGVTAAILGYALIPYWAGVVMMVFRRANHLGAFDRWFILMGYPLVVISFIFWQFYRSGQ